jgi:hypothetical protein
MISPAQDRPQKHEIELRSRRNERGSESTKMDRLRIKLEKLQQRQTQLRMQLPRAS